MGVMSSWRQSPEIGVELNYQGSNIYFISTKLAQLSYSHNIEDRNQRIDLLVSFSHHLISKHSCLIFCNCGLVVSWELPGPRKGCLSSKVLLN